MAGDHNDDDDGDLVLARGVRIPAQALQFEYSRGSGPGGQNVNKVNSKVTLRLDLRGADFLDEGVRARLLEKLATRVTTAGVLVLHASEYRDQPRNRTAAVARLRALLAAALERPKPRRPTRPTRGSVERRIQASKRTSEVKRMRKRPRLDE